MERKNVRRLLVISIRKCVVCYDVHTVASEGICHYLELGDTWDGDSHGPNGRSLHEGRSRGVAFLLAGLGKRCKLPSGLRRGAPVA